jgi:hypothetical protein
MKHLQSGQLDHGLDHIYHGQEFEREKGRGRSESLTDLLWGLQADFLVVGLPRNLTVGVSRNWGSW